MTEPTLTQNQLHSPPSSGEPATETQKSILSIGFIMLVVFGLFRPISLTIGFFTVFGMSLFEIFGIGISYMLLIPVLLYFRNLRLDRTTLLSIFFCLYCAGSVLWGSDFTNFFRVTLPLIVLFVARIVITEPKQIHAILVALIISNMIPIVTSTYMIIFGRGIELVDYWSGIARFEGSFGGSHGLAYAMLFFSFIYCLLKQTCQLSGRLSKFGLLVLQLLAIFCLYKSYTRTAITGFIIFWLIYFWGTNKKHFILAIIAGFLVLTAASQQVKTIFWKTRTEQYDLNAASSGRLALWRHNIQLFFDSTIPQQILGRGLGIEGKHGGGVIGSKTDVWAPHNDYLSLLMSLGVIGLCIYLALLASLFWDICTCGLDRSTRYFFLGLIVSVAIMNSLSNAIVFRLELSQYFWLFMGFFYFAKERAGADQLSSTEPDRSYFPI